MTLTGRGQRESNDSLVVDVRLSADEVGALGSVHELDDAVVSEQQVVGDVGDARRRSMPTHGEQQLVLACSDPSSSGRLLAPAEEPPQAVAKREQPAEVLLVEPTSSGCAEGHIVARY